MPGWTPVLQRKLVTDAYTVLSEEIQAHINSANRHHLRKVCGVDLGG